MALSRVISEIFNIEKYPDLEIRVSGHSRSLKVVPFNRLPMVSFKVMTFFDIEYLKNDTRYSHSYYRTSIGSRMRSVEWWHSQ